MTGDENIILYIFTQTTASTRLPLSISTRYWMVRSISMSATVAPDPSVILIGPFRLSFPDLRGSACTPTKPIEAHVNVARLTVLFEE